MISYNLDKLFSLRSKVQLMVDEYSNKERDIETKIPEGSLLFPIFFLICISKIFNKVLDISLLITSLLIVDDLGFIALGYLVKKLVKTLKNTAKEIME